jgi:hypothetical protein
MATDLLWGLICLAMGIGSIVHSYFIDPNRPARQIYRGLGRSFTGKEMKWRSFWGGVGTTALGMLLLTWHFFSVGH